MEAEERTPLIRHQAASSSSSSYFTSRRRSQCYSLFLGQLLSVLLCLSGVTSVYLSTLYSLHLPTFQNFLFYFLLSAVFTSALACRSINLSPSSSSSGEGGGGLLAIIKARGWRYYLLALCDAEANFLVVKAYQYTTLTSVQLLDCFTIPTVLLLSRFLLGTRYRIIHILGVGICLLGVGCLVWADIQEGIPFGEGNDRLMGDILCLSGAFLYGVSNVAQEFLVKTFDMVEFLGMIGFFGALITGMQACLLEWDQVSQAVAYTESLFAVFGLLVAFALIQFSFYIVAARLMKMSGATAYNLSILTADFYSLVLGIFLFQYQFHGLYFVSFVLVLAGVAIFSIKPTVTAHSVHSHVTINDNDVPEQVEPSDSVVINSSEPASDGVI